MPRNKIRNQFSAWFGEMKRVSLVRSWCIFREHAHEKGNFPQNARKREFPSKRTKKGISLKNMKKGNFPQNKIEIF